MSRVIGIAVEGLGLQLVEGGSSRGELNGVMLATSTEGVPSGTGGYDWRAWLVEPSISPPGETRIDWLSQSGGRLAPLSGSPIALHGHDDIATTLLRKESSFVARAASDISDTATSISLDDATLSANAPLYLHEEAVWVQSNDGSGAYTVERGIWGTVARAHSTNTAAYQRPTGWRQRRVILYTYDTDTDTLESRTRGRIYADTGDVIWQDASTVYMQAEQLTAGMKSNPLARRDGALRLNLDPVRYEPDDYDIAIRTTGTEPRLLNGSIHAELETRVKKAPGTSLVFQFRDTIAVVDSDGAFRADPPPLESIDNIDGPLTTDEAANPDKPDLVEIMLVDRDADTQRTNISSTLALGSIGASAHGVAIDDASIYPYHALAIWGAITLSTRADSATPEDFDILKAPHMGADLAYLFSEDIFATLHELIQQTQGEHYLVDHLAELGWGGESIDVLDWGDRWLHAYGFKRAVDKNGKMTVTRLRLPDVDDVDAALSNRLTAISGEDVTQHDGAGQVTDVISATVGELPWRRGRTVKRRATDGQAERNEVMSASSDVDLEFPGISVDKPGKAVAMVLARALAQQVPIPRVRLPVDDWVHDSTSHTDLSLGAPASLDTINFELAWYVRQQGTRVNIDGSKEVAYIGYITGVDPDHKSGKHIVTVMLPSEQVVRLRAPFGKIEGVTESGGKTHLDLGATSNVGAVGNDADEFLRDSTPIGQAQILDKDFTLHESTFLSVDSVSGDELVLDGTFTTTPAAGQYVTIARYGDYSATNLSDNVARIYVFLADDDETLGTSDDDGDLIGM